MQSPGQSESEDCAGTWWENGLRAIDEYDWDKPLMDHTGGGDERASGTDDVPVLKVSAVSALVGVSSLDSNWPSLADSENPTSDAQTPATYHSCMPPESPTMKLNDFETGLVNNDVGIPQPEDTAAPSPPVERHFLAGLEEAAQAGGLFEDQDLQTAEPHEAFDAATDLPDSPNLGEILIPTLGANPFEDADLTHGQMLSALPEQDSTFADARVSDNVITDDARSSPSPLQPDVHGIAPPVNTDVTSDARVEDTETEDESDPKPCPGAFHGLANGPLFFANTNCHRQMSEVKLDEEEKLTPDAKIITHKPQHEELNTGVSCFAESFRHEEDYKDPQFPKTDITFTSSTSIHEYHQGSDNHTPSIAQDTAMYETYNSGSETEYDENVAPASVSSPDLGASNDLSSEVSGPTSLGLSVPEIVILMDSLDLRSMEHTSSGMNDDQHDSVDAADTPHGTVTGSSPERPDSLGEQPLTTMPSLEPLATSAIVPADVTDRNVHLPPRFGTTVIVISAANDAELDLVNAGRSGVEALLPNNASADLNTSQLLNQVPGPVGTFSIPNECLLTSADESGGLSYRFQHTEFSDPEDTRSVRAHRGSPANAHELSDVPCAASDNDGSDQETAVEPGRPEKIQMVVTGEPDEPPEATAAFEETENRSSADVDVTLEGDAEETSKTEAPQVTTNCPDTDCTALPVNETDEHEDSAVLSPSVTVSTPEDSSLQPAFSEAAPGVTPQSSSPIKEQPEVEQATAAPHAELTVSTQAESPALQPAVAQPTAPASLIPFGHQQHHNDSSSELSNAPEEEESPTSPFTPALPVQSSANKEEAQASLSQVKSGWKPVGQLTKEGIERLSDRRETKIRQPKEKGKVIQYRVKFTGLGIKYSRWINAYKLNEVVPELVAQYEAEATTKGTETRSLSINTGQRRRAAPSSFQEPASPQVEASENPIKETSGVKAKPRSKLGLKRSRALKNLSSNADNEKNYRPEASDSDEEPPKKKSKKSAKASTVNKPTTAKGKRARQSLDGADDGEMAIEAREMKDKLQVKEGARDSPQTSQSRSLTDSDFEPKYGKRTTRSNLKMEKHKLMPAPVTPAATVTPAPAASKSTKAKTLTVSAKRKRDPQGEAISPSRKRQTRRVSGLVEKETNIGKRLRSGKK